MDEAKGRNSKSDQEKPDDQKETQGSKGSNAVSAFDSPVELELIQLGDSRSRCLRTPCSDIDITSSPELKLLAQSMEETLYKSKGVGLAANQVGVVANLILIDPWYVKDGNRQAITMINPRVLPVDEVHEIQSIEGCLSCVGTTVDVPRVNKIHLEWTDLDGDKDSQTFEDFDATVIQHELDHLQGRLIIDYMSRMRKDMYLRKIKKVKRIAKRIARENNTNRP